ncbi:hypothetical protein RRG08_030392 [Elysia crispata]|uniref:Uncharacterized protein n=1 Tax=Elysia crispata TaxID=231223 RepID=A0AAE0YFT2_9GAST|nr:hypothetical protein RRG08_030392 [Elysia crispata]
MRHLDLSFEGKHLAEKNQLDNGKLPHGGYRGSKKHPPSHLSYDKGRQFQQRLEEELSRIMEVEDMSKHGGSPAWSILVHNSPSYTDESPLITNNLLAASKSAQINGISLHNRTSLLPKKCPRPERMEARAYYRPNRMHQYLSATELKNSASEDASVMYGRPTRTTLLRARQRSNSAPHNQLEKKRDFAQRIDEIKTAPAGNGHTTEYLQLQSVRDGESLHSYLTGARYNRAHCLDSKSVEHNGVYMPRHNPALGSFFTGPKGQEYLQEFGDSPRQDMPTPPSPPSAKRRPLTAPSYGRRPVHAPGQPSYKSDHSSSSKYKYLKLNIVGSRLPLVSTREAHQPLGLRLPKLAETANLTDRRLGEALDQTYLVNQPMPTPSGAPYVDINKHSKLRRSEEELFIEAENARVHKRDEENTDFAAIRIDGRSTWKTKPVEPLSETDEEESSARVPIAVELEKPIVGDEQREEMRQETEKPQELEETFEEAEIKAEMEEGGAEQAVTEEIRDGQKENKGDEKKESAEDEIVEEKERQKEEEEAEEKANAKEPDTMQEPVISQVEEVSVEDQAEKEEEMDRVLDEEIQEEPEHVEATQDRVEISKEEKKNEEKGDEEIDVPTQSDNVEKEKDEKQDQDNVLFFITEDGFGNTKTAPDSSSHHVRKEPAEDKDEDDASTFG